MKKEVIFAEPLELSALALVFLGLDEVFFGFFGVGGNDGAGLKERFDGPVSGSAITSDVKLRSGSGLRVRFRFCEGGEGGDDLATTVVVIVCSVGAEGCWDDAVGLDFALANMASMPSFRWDTGSMYEGDSVPTLPTSLGT